MTIVLIEIVGVYLAIGAILGLMYGGSELAPSAMEDVGVREALKTAGIAFLSMLFLWPLFIWLLVRCELRERKRKDEQ